MENNVNGALLGEGRRQVPGRLRWLGSAASWHRLWHLPLCDRHLGMVECPREALTTSPQESPSLHEIKIPNDISLLTSPDTLENWVFLPKGPVWTKASGRLWEWAFSFLSFHWFLGKYLQAQGALLARQNMELDEDFFSNALLQRRFSGFAQEPSDGVS